MIPHPSSALSMLSGRLMMQLLPDLKTEYNMSDGMLMGLLMNALAEELESGVETRLQDIREMQALFRTALERFERQRLPDDIEALSEHQPADMTLKSVNELHNRITRVLIALHEMVESRPEDDDAGALNDEIWAYLGRLVERHRITAAG